MTLPARIIDGKQIAAEMRTELEPAIKDLRKVGITPGLAVVLVGDDPASQVYVRMKGKACDTAGIHSETIILPSATPEAELLDVVDRLNGDPAIHGILVQLPLPDHVNETGVLYRIRPDKDVDGFHPENVGKVSIGDPTGFRPATPYGVQQMLVRSRVQVSGAHVVIVGRSNIVGRPLASLLLPGALFQVVVVWSQLSSDSSVRPNTLTTYSFGTVLVPPLLLMETFIVSAASTRSSA